MTYYAIKHLPSGNYLPQLRKKRGHSHTEPLPLDQAVPRLHKSVKNAKLALWYWLRGAWHESYSRSDWEGFVEYEGNEPHKRSERRKEDMAIVGMSVRENKS